METRLLGPRSIGEAAEIIKSGGLVAVPTETVYGLACNGLDAAAVERVFKVKGRPESKPLSLLVAGAEVFAEFAEGAPPAARALAEEYWPGPLTMVLSAKGIFPPATLAGGATVGLRCPAHPLTLELIKTLNLPLAAPSANPSGATSPKTAREVLGYFSGMIDAVLDGGECELGAESTVLDLTRDPFQVLRQGTLPSEEIFSFLRKNLKVIGVTGPTGAGKSTAMATLRSLGALTIDCDLLYHKLLDENKAMISELARRFPQTAGDEGIDRKALGAIVFSDSRALSDLNEITHKYVSRAIEDRLSEWSARGGTAAGIDAIALIESGGAKRCGAIVGILASKADRIERIISREGISRQYAQTRVSAQRDDEYYTENCDYVVYNNGSAEEFEIGCRELFIRLLKE